MKMFFAVIASLLLLATVVTNAEAAGVPAWVKNNAGWWSDGTISENDFLNGIQYLIKMGIMQVSSTAVSDDMSSPSQYQSSSTESKESKSSSGTELENMLPWERQIYVQMLTDFIREENEKNKERLK